MQNLKELVKHALLHAKKCGATAAEIGASSGNGFSINVRLGEVDTLEHHLGKDFVVTVYIGQKKASASTNDLSKDAINTTIEKALSAAKYVDSDPANGLPEKDLIAYDYPDLDLYHPWEISVENAIKLAKENEKIGMESDKRITNSEGINIATGETHYVCANSLDFIGEFSASQHSMSCAFIAGENDAMQRDYSYTNARDAKDLASFESVAQAAAQKTIARLNPKKISTQSCPIIFIAEIASSLFSSFISAINGYNLYRRSSFLLEAIGKQIFSDKIIIEEQPHLLKAMGSVPFDNEGVRNKGQIIMQDGILKSYVLDCYSGRKLKMPTTGNAGGVHNLVIQPGNQDLDKLLQTMGNGILITELMGQGANIVSGDYSQAAFGYLVENGRIQYPVDGFTVVGNLKDMFMNILALGNDVDKRGNILTGSVLIDKMTIAGA